MKSTAATHLVATQVAPCAPVGKGTDMTTTTTPSILPAEVPAIVGGLPFAGTAVAYWRAIDSHGFAYPSGARMSVAKASADVLRHLDTANAKASGTRCAVAIYGRTFTRAPHTAVRGNVEQLANGRTFAVLAGTMPSKLAAVILAAGGRIIGGTTTPEPTAAALFDPASNDPNTMARVAAIAPAGAQRRPRGTEQPSSPTADKADAAASVTAAGSIGGADRDSIRRRAAAAID